MKNLNKSIQTESYIYVDVKHLYLDNLELNFVITNNFRNITILFMFNKKTLTNSKIN